MAAARTVPEAKSGAHVAASGSQVLVLARGSRPLKGIRRALGLVGCSWTVAGDQQAALQHLGRHAPDLVLVDLATFRGQGPGVLHALRQACAAPILLVSGQTLDGQHLRPLLGQADALYSAPLQSGLSADLLKPPQREPDSRLRILSGLGAITRTLGPTVDNRVVHEQLLDLLHVELGLPCALLVSEPRHACLASRSERGPQLEAASLLRLAAGSLSLETGELEVVEADPGGADLAEWCARHGYARAALAPIRGRGRFKGALLVLADEDRPFHPQDLDILAAVSGQAAILLDNLELHQVARARQVLVEKLLERVIYAQEEERKWMAAEIHDTIAQSLVGMHTMVQTCRQILHSDPEQVGGLLDALRGLVTESLAEIRQILFNLRPASLDDLGLVPSLENYARRFMQSSDIHLTMHLPGRNQSRLPPLLETTVFRITQEALSNIKKHSRAQSARVTLDIGTTDLRLTVADDGRGLVWSEVSERFQSGESYGLHGMQERARLLGGTFRFSNDPTGGAILEVVIPLAQPTPSGDFGPSPLGADLDLLLQEVLGGESQEDILAVDSRRTL